MTDIESTHISESPNKTCVKLNDDDFMDAAGLQRGDVSGKKSSVEKLLGSYIIFLIDIEVTIIQVIKSYKFLDSIYVYEFSFNYNRAIIKHSRGQSTFTLNNIKIERT